MNDPIEQFLNAKARTALEWEDVIKEMVDSGDYHYAEDTLMGIYGYIENYGTVSDAQIQAIINIKNKPAYDRR